MKESASSAGVSFTWEFDSASIINTCHIVTDYGWKTSMDCGLDIFQHDEITGSFTFANRLQQQYQCEFEVMLIKTETS